MVLFRLAMRQPLRNDEQESGVQPLLVRCLTKSISKPQVKA
jgi:hypothetical protein